MRKLSFNLILVLFLGCATSSTIRHDDRVSILLKDGTKIEGQIVDVSSDEITFEAVDKKKAFDYGERILVGQVRGIQMPDGDVLGVREYRARMKGERPIIASTPASAKTSAKARSSRMVNNSQYEEIKNKPIAEMTDNEFKFFMMMKEKELDSQAGGVQSEGTVNPNFSKNDVALEQLVDSIVEAGLAANYLSFMKDKSRREGLTSFEKKVVNLIERHPGWRKQLEILKSASKEGA